MLSPVRTPARVMVAQFDEGERRAVALASRLRGGGIPTVLYPAPSKLRKQLKHANELKVPYVAMIGDDEASRGTVTLKNMETGEQKEQTVEEVLGELEEKVGQG